jgi:hypothetical protein
MDGWMDGWVGGWVGGWVAGKAGLRIAYSNQKLYNFNNLNCVFGVHIDLTKVIIMTTIATMMINNIKPINIISVFTVFNPKLKLP